MPEYEITIRKIDTARGKYVEINNYEALNILIKTCAHMFIKNAVVLEEPYEKMKSFTIMTNFGEWEKENG